MKWVRFRKIELHNYRQFQEEKIEFKEEKGNEMFNIILGRNGFGKSNLFNAITWCFYGIEKHLKNGPSEDRLPILNKAVAKKMKPNGIEEVKVNVWLESDEGIIKITRTINFFGVKEGFPRMDNRDDFKISRTTPRGDWIECPGPTTIINKILPEVVMDFFFLDGEKLRQQFEDIDEEGVKKAIIDVSQINLLEKALIHLNCLYSETRREIKSDDPEVESLGDDISGLEDYISKFPEAIKKYDSQKKEAELNKKKLEVELRESNSEFIKKAQIDRDEITKEIESDNEQLDMLNEEYQEYLIDSTKVILLLEGIEKTLDILKDLIKDGKIPPKVRDTFLKELLAKKECICGADISHGKSRDKILELLNEMEYSDVADEANELKYNLKAQILKLKEFDKKTDGYLNKIEVLTKKIGLKNGKLSEISQKLRKYKDSPEKIKEKEEAILDYTSSIETLIATIAVAKREELEYNRKLEEKKTEYKKKLEKSKKNQESVKKIAFLDECIKNLSVLKEEMLNEIRKEIEVNVQKNFFENLITEKKLKEITINENYKISVITEEGYNTLKSLSAGETLCLALSFMAALRKVSGFPAPIIIDTPLAKIDEEYRENVINFLINSLKGNQINLLVMSSEYTSQVRNLIKAHINEEFEIKFDRDSGVSNVE